MIALLNDEEIKNFCEEIEQKGGENLLDYAFARRALPKAKRIIQDLLQEILKMKNKPGYNETTEIMSLKSQTKFNEEVINDLRRQLQGGSND